MDGSELLQTSHLSKAEHSAFSSSKRQVGILSPIMPISGTPQPKALILAAAPDALAAEADRQGIQGIVFCDALDQIEATVMREEPDCLAVFHDIDFSGRELAAAAHAPSVK